jgi:hypothetical protein
MVETEEERGKRYRFNADFRRNALIASSVLWRSWSYDNHGKQERIGPINDTSYLST